MSVVWPTAPSIITLNNHTLKEAANEIHKQIAEFKAKEKVSGISDKTYAIMIDGEKRFLRLILNPFCSPDNSQNISFNSIKRSDRDWDINCWTRGLLLGDVEGDDIIRAEDHTVTPYFQLLFLIKEIANKSLGCSVSIFMNEVFSVIEPGKSKQCSFTKEEITSLFQSRVYLSSNPEEVKRINAEFLAFEKEADRVKKKAEERFKGRTDFTLEEFRAVMSADVKALFAQK